MWAAIAVASSLFGLSDTTTLNYGAFSGVRYKDFSLYAQDTYKFSNKLTLNFGLRYDIDLPASEAFDRFSAVDPNLPNPGAGGLLGAYTYFGTGAGRNGQTRPQDTYTKAFGPRVGFAYSIDPKTVIRGGYGIFYEPLKEGSFADQDGLGFFNQADGQPFERRSNSDRQWSHADLPGSGTLSLQTARTEATASFSFRKTADVLRTFRPGTWTFNAN